VGKKIKTKMINQKNSKSQNNKSFLVNENDLVQFFDSDFKGKKELFFIESNLSGKIALPKTKAKELFVRVVCTSKFTLDDISRIADKVYSNYQDAELYWALQIADESKLQVAGFE
jgi:hypothetical protein